MVISIPKRKPYRNKKIRDHARGQKCTIKSQYCNHSSDTTVFCHFNEQWAGKGKGQKADDCAGVFGCSACHWVMDQRQISELSLFSAYIETLVILFDARLLPEVPIGEDRRETYEHVRQAIDSKE